MTIRRAKKGDIPAILELLSEVCAVHRAGRPDIFVQGTKYNEAEINAMLEDDMRPILVADSGGVVGYAFCEIKPLGSGGAIKKLNTLYIDDLCVREGARGGGIGSALFAAAEALAKNSGCYNITLNVWSCNPAALEFYRRKGLTEMKRCMEKIVK